MSESLYVEMIFGVVPPVTDVDTFHSLGDRLMEALLDAEACNDDVRDSAVSTAADTGRLEVELVVLNAPNAMDGLQKALDFIRAAAHGVGFGTAGWPCADDLVPVAVQATPVEELVSA